MRAEKEPYTGILLLILETCETLNIKFEIKLKKCKIISVKMHTKLLKCFQTRSMQPIKIKLYLLIRCSHLRVFVFTGCKVMGRTHEVGGTQ